MLRLAEPIAMAAFDKDRPLWEFTLVEGLADGRAALVEKIHHSVTDGVGGLLLAELIVDDQRRGRLVTHDRDRAGSDAIGSTVGRRWRARGRGPGRDR